MKKSLELIAACTVTLLAFQLASAQPPEPPKPGPEHKRLGFFVGQWKGEGEMKPGEMGPGGKVTSTEKCDWFDGGFAVVCHGEGMCPMGATKSLGVISYSPEEQVYTYYATQNVGMTMTTVPRGTIQGDTWNYTDESMMGGKKVKTRVTIKELSPTAYTFAMDVQGPDGKWNPVMQSTHTKVQ